MTERPESSGESFIPPAAAPPPAGMPPTGRAAQPVFVSAGLRRTVATAILPADAPTDYYAGAPTVMRNGSASPR